jgi:hypothetical protein
MNIISKKEEVSYNLKFTFFGVMYQEINNGRNPCVTKNWHMQQSPISICQFLAQQNPHPYDLKLVIYYP